MAQPAYYEMKPLVLGDTWGGLDNITITPSGFSFDYPVSGGRIQFRKEKKRGGVPLDEVSTVNGCIVIEDANTWSFSIPEANLNLIAGDIYWDFETTDTNGRIKTYLEGILPVLQNVTR